MTTTDRTATAPYGTPPKRGSRTLAIGAVVALVALIAGGMAIGLAIHNNGHKKTTAAKPGSPVASQAPVVTTAPAVTTTAAPVTTAAPAVTTTTAPSAVATGPGGMTAASAAIAAEKIYRQYVAAHNAVFRAGGKGYNSLKKVELGNGLNSDLAQAYNVWAPQGLHQVGWDKVLSVAPWKVSLATGQYTAPYVILKACLDSTSTGVVNAKGQSESSGGASTPTWCTAP